MTKIIMLFWVLTDTGAVTEPQEIGNFRTMEECEVAAVSLTETNAKLKATHKYAIIAQCIVVPK